MSKHVWWLSAGVLVLSCGGTETANPALADASTSDVAAPLDAGSDTSTCALTMCGAACVDTSHDPKNCGGCKTRCASAICTASGCEDATVLAFSKLYLGDTDLAGTPSTVAWKDFGDDIDGIDSTGGADAGASQVCKPVGGGPPVHDGTGGIDNSFGANIVPLIENIFGANFSAQVNQLLTASNFSDLVRIEKLGTSSDATGLHAAFFGGGPALSPAFDGTDVWPVTWDSVIGGDIGAPVVTYSASQIAARVWSSGVTSTLGGSFSLPIFGLGTAMPVNRIRLRMAIAADGKSATSGIVSGVIPTEAFIAAFHVYAGSISTSLCSPAAFDGIAQQLRQASDILVDGTQDPTKDCDGISLGLGFEAKSVKLGDVLAKSPPPVDVCE